MKIGAGLLLIAVGAVLRFAVTKQVNGVSLGTVGVIMMIVGAAGLLITFIMMSTRRRTDFVYGHNSVSYVEPAESVDPRF
jgi:membrane-bound ClpP family serine protease